MIFRAALGFAMALTLLHGQGWVMPPALQAVKADIAASRPEVRLQSLADQTTSTLAARFGTARTEITRPDRARVLQP
ncbi:MAG TPA: hypothetical protein VFV07_01755 [Rhizomicrobium sp.]|nr:hypothetical protein [Rhizomicrobium sp.]